VFLSKASIVFYRGNFEEMNFLMIIYLGEFIFGILLLSFQGLKLLSQNQLRIKLIWPMIGWLLFLTLTIFF
jgi:hypothetical protein